MGYNAGKYLYLHSHGTTEGKEAGVTYLESTILKHLVLDVLQGNMHTRTGRPTQWRAEGGVARHSLKGLPSSFGVPV